MQRFLKKSFLIFVIIYSQSLYAQLKNTDSSVSSKQISPPSSKQSNTIDSLSRALARSQKITEKYELLLALTLAAEVEGEALKYALDARQLAFQIGDSAEIVRTSRMSAWLLNRISQEKRAEEILLSTIPIARRNGLRSDQARMLNILGIIYTFQAKYDKALKTHFQGLEVREKEKHRAGIVVSLFNIGLVYYKMKHYDKALE